MGEQVPLLKPRGVVALFEQFGLGYVMGTLGAAHANADGLTNEFINALRDDPVGDLFRKICLRGAARVPEKFKTLNARIGNAVHQMEQAYNAASAPGHGFQNPTFGKMSAVQLQYEMGFKSTHVPIWNWLYGNPFVGLLELTPVSPTPIPQAQPITFGCGGQPFFNFFPCAPWRTMLTQGAMIFQ